MSSPHRTLVLVVTINAILAAGCSSNIAATSPTAQLPLAQKSATYPALDLHRHESHAPRHGWISPEAKSGTLLFIAASGVVLIYKVGKQPKLVGTLTDEITSPAGLWVDEKRNLYVVNENPATVLVFPPNSTSPTQTYPSPCTMNCTGTPISVAVDSHGEVYFGRGTDGGQTGFIYEFKQGSPTPFQTITDDQNPLALNFDHAGNLYASTNSQGILKYSPGSTNGVPLLTGLGQTQGVAFDSDHDLVVSNDAGDNTETIYFYKRNQTAPFRQIGPFHSQDLGLVFDQSGNLYASEILSGVVDIYPNGHAKGAKQITNLSNPIGVAVSPPLRQ